MRLDLFFAAALTLSSLGVISTDLRAEQGSIPVDLELAFVVDASGSIDDDELYLQRKGYADALVNPRVISAITSGFLRSIAIAYIEFSGTGCSQISVNWTRVYNQSSAKEFGNKILSLPRIDCLGGNAIGEAVALTVGSIENNQFEGTRRVIDVSGDGPNTLAPSIEVVRAEAVGKQITINALAIERPSMPDLPEYFKRSVAGGSGSFVMKVENRSAFAKAILRKILREIADINVLDRSQATRLN